MQKIIITSICTVFCNRAIDYYVGITEDKSIIKQLINKISKKQITKISHIILPLKKWIVIINLNILDIKIDNNFFPYI